MATAFFPLRFKSLLNQLGYKFPLIPFAPMYILLLFLVMIGSLTRVFPTIDALLKLSLIHI